MITVEEPVQNKIYNEDIVLTGETIIGNPCVVYSITITNDSATAAVVKLSNYATYSNSYIVSKVAIAANSTIHMDYPRGMKLSAGLSAAANQGSIDIAVTYD